MLQLADLVKFAKWQPTPDENETALLAAYQFVKETKPVITEEEKEKYAPMMDVELRILEFIRFIILNGLLHMAMPSMIPVLEL